jgi:hypothetical protein
MGMSDPVQRLKTDLEFYWLLQPERKGPVKGSRHGWEDNIKVDLKEGVFWICVAQDTCGRLF